jgi:hypothetical protein
MTTSEENQSLKECELPLEPVTLAIVDYATNCPADRVLTSILMIDEQRIKILATATPYLQNLLEQREKLLDRAKKENIKEDAEAVLVEIPGKLMRNDIEDIDTFQATFEEGYRKIRETQKQDILDAADKKIANLEDAPVPLGLADKKIGKDKVTEFVGYKLQVINYEVRKR